MSEAAITAAARFQEKCEELEGLLDQYDHDAWKRGLPIAAISNNPSIRSGKRERDRQDRSFLVSVRWRPVAALVLALALSAILVAASARLWVALVVAAAFVVVLQLLISR